MLIFVAGVHPVLGPVHVRLLLRLQHHRPAQHADRHDVQLLPDHLGEIRHRVEVCSDQAVDLLLRDGRHRPSALQHLAHAKGVIQV